MKKKEGDWEGVGIKERLKNWKKQEGKAGAFWGRRKKQLESCLKCGGAAVFGIELSSGYTSQFSVNNNIPMGLSTLSMVAESSF